MSEALIIVGKDVVELWLDCSKCKKREKFEIRKAEVSCPSCQHVELRDLKEEADYSYLAKRFEYYHLVRLFQDHDEVVIRANQRYLMEARKVVEEMAVGFGCEVVDDGELMDYSKRTGRKVIVNQLRLRKNKWASWQKPQRAA